MKYRLFIIGAALMVALLPLLAETQRQQKQTRILSVQRTAIEADLAWRADRRWHRARINAVQLETPFAQFYEVLATKPPAIGYTILEGASWVDEDGHHHMLTPGTVRVWNDDGSVDDHPVNAFDEVYETTAAVWVQYEVL